MVEAEWEVDMEKIEWNDFKGVFPKGGVYLVRYIDNRRKEEDCSFAMVYDNDNVCFSESTAKGKVCVDVEDVTIMGYVYLYDLVV